MSCGTADDPAHNSPTTSAAGEAPLEPESSAGGGAAGPEVRTRDSHETKRERPQWETAKTLEEYWDTRKTFFTEEQRADAWNETANIVKAYSDELVDRWNKEIDNLLIYAGLFSAIQTAFNVELYKRLTPEPDPDPVLIALERISAQLSGFAVNAALVNSTQPRFALSSDVKTPAVPLWIVVLNALWFSSLISSLAAASIGIMVKQWLTEYKSGVSGTSRQTARLRQLRLHSLQRWRVEEIVSTLPVLLQFASGLFFAGLLILLWNLNRAVAIVGTILVGILAIFSLFTIVLPSVATHCSYLSPPSRVLFALTRPWRKVVYYGRRNLSSCIAMFYGYSVRRFYDLDLNSEFANVRQFWGKHPRIYRLCKMLFPRDASSTLAWRGTESALVSRHAEKLDGEMVSTAYTTSMDTNYLHHAAVCITELSLKATSTCFGRILSANIAHWGKNRHELAMWAVHPYMWSGALIALMNISSDDTAWSPPTLAAALRTAYYYMLPSSQQYQSDAQGTRLVCVDFVRIIRHYNHSIVPPESLNLAENIYQFGLRYAIEGTQHMNIGNAVRQYVISVYIDDALKGLGRPTIEDTSTLRALQALRSIIYCVPARDELDCKYDDPEYKAIQSQAARALQDFSSFLSTPEADEYSFHINDVFDALREHGERAGLVSAELRQAIVRYRYAYQSAHEELPSWWEHIEEWILKLKRELELEDFGQNAAAGSVTSASAKTEHALSVGAAPTAIVNSVVVSEGATSQLAGDDDGACAQTQLAFDRSSSAGHVASTPAEPEHSFPFNAVWTAVNGAVAGAHRFPTG